MMKITTVRDSCQKPKGDLSSNLRMIAIISRSMKLVLTSILMLLVFIQSFSNWFIFLEYQSNKSFIAEKLCINKLRPKLHCNGKCQMMKKIAEQEEQNSSSSGNQPRLKYPEIAIHDNNVLLLRNDFNEITSAYSNFFQVRTYSAPFKAIFHPPA